MNLRSLIGQFNQDIIFHNHIHNFRANATASRNAAILNLFGLFDIFLHLLHSKKKYFNLLIHCMCSFMASAVVRGSHSSALFHIGGWKF